MKLRGYRQMAGQPRPTSAWPPMTSHIYQTGQQSSVQPRHHQLITVHDWWASSNLHQFQESGLGTLLKPATNTLLKPATNTLRKLAKQELSNKPRRPPGKQRIRRVASLFQSTRIRHFQPNLPASAKSHADKRERNRRLNLTDETLNDLNKQIEKLVLEDKRTKWQSAVDKFIHRTNISHLWQLVQDQSGNKPYNSPNTGVRLIEKTYLDLKKIANKFAHQCIPSPIRLAGDKSKRQLFRQFNQLPLTGTPSFTPADTKEAIRLAKSSRAIGPDGMSTLQLKKLAHGSINHLTNICNLSISTWQLPEILYKAIIIPIQKPGKDDNIGKNWRTISLLCPAAKTLEKLMLPKILTHINFHSAQHNFGRNTQHALHCRRSPPTSQAKRRLTEHYSSRSNW